MKYFVLTYDGTTGTLLNTSVHEAIGEALLVRRDQELQHRGGVGIEVVLIRAPSESAIRKTHGRYFRSVNPRRTAPRGNLETA